LLYSGVAENLEDITENFKLAMELDYPIKKFNLNHEVSHGTREGQSLAVNYMAKLLKNNLEDLQLESGFERPLFPPTPTRVQYPKLKNLSTFSYYLGTPGCEFLNSVPGLQILELIDGLSKDATRLISMRITHTQTPILVPSLVKLVIQNQYFSLSSEAVLGFFLGSANVGWAGG